MTPTERADVLRRIAKRLGGNPADTRRGPRPAKPKAPKPKAGSGPWVTVLAEHVEKLELAGDETPPAERVLHDVVTGRPVPGGPTSVAWDERLYEWGGPGPEVPDDRPTPGDPKLSRMRPKRRKPRAWTGQELDANGNPWRGRR